MDEIKLEDEEFKIEVCAKPLSVNNEDQKDGLKLTWQVIQGFQKFDFLQSIIIGFPKHYLLSDYGQKTYKL